jgi:hypothetical protein
MKFNRRAFYRSKKPILPQHCDFDSERLRKTAQSPVTAALVRTKLQDGDVVS